MNFQPNPHYKLLSVSLELVNEKLYTNLIFGNGYTYRGEGVVISGMMTGLTSMIPIEECDTEECVDYILDPEDTIMLKVKEISNYL
jgi:hypothetical protein